VTFGDYRNTYVYSAAKLWVAYGVVILLVAIIVICGLIVMAKNGASFSANFSSIFRAARGSGISTEIKEEDMGGEDPLPKYLNHAKIRLGTHVNTRASSFKSQSPSTSSLRTLKEPTAHSRLLAPDKIDGNVTLNTGF
jgi:hypothetical protein